ncbi:hypothetical protein N836_02650 [Leptolyngbya sp. Heron Island J]|uniref:hypothetical protein n=1 Tax=Leptolyngbya sp. Heron Island J TaxID=1385935 RepID=UPI0003B9EB3B|nr:hypothetical protein [Leptolyngbya sp. Heron Island J]ESA38420.1 hypothetical protein N836_02650 [Leptolyngbya sp. Heron Island J]
MSYRPKQPAKIVQLDILDTDYAAMVAGEPISDERKQRLEATDPQAFQYISRQISKYRYGCHTQEERDDALYNIGAMVGLMTPSDIEDVNDRLRHTGHLYLTQGERVQILNWLEDELAVSFEHSLSE